MPRGLKSGSESVTKMVATKRAAYLAKYPDGLRQCVDCLEKKDLSEFLYSRGKTRTRCSQCQIDYNFLRHAKHKYGLNTKETQALLDQNECAICGDPAEHIDHDHGTGIVRGRLCKPCNSGLGFMQDDPNRLMAAAAYLLQHTNVLRETGI